MRLLLISPSNKPGRKVLKAIRMPQLGLHIIASLTPEDVDITVVDEQIKRDRFLSRFRPGRDLLHDRDGQQKLSIGRQVQTERLARSFSAAFTPRSCRKKPYGMPMPSSSERRKAAGRMSSLISESNKLRKFYHVPAPDLSKSPSPRRDFQIDKALFNCVGLVTTRGCPYACEFCSVTDFYGGKIRHRPVSMVVEDIKRSGSKAFLILDDNVAGHPEYSKQLFEALIPLGIHWVGQSSISLAKDREMLNLCRQSGCAALFFGVESVSPASLIGLKKSLKSIKETEEAVRIIQDNGIAFHPSIILGFDTDTNAIFDDTLAFLARTRLPTMALNVLTPYPGTRLYRRFKDQGRIISDDWSHYDHHTVVFRPKNMTPQEFAEGHHYVQSEFYSFSSILRHIPSLLRVSPVNLRRALVFLLLNFAGKNVAKYIDTSLDWADNREKWHSPEALGPTSPSHPRRSKSGVPVRRKG